VIGVNAVALKEAQALGIGGQALVVLKLVGMPGLIIKHENTSFRGDYSNYRSHSQERRKAMNENENKQNDKLVELFGKMNDEQRALWIAVGDGMVMAQDIIERRAS
jgi:hypothetical protein